MYGCVKDCLILIPFRLPQISCFTLSLKCVSFDSDICPFLGIRPLLQFPHPLRADPVLLTLLFFSPSSITLLSFAWFYIFFSAGEVLLSALSWCSACSSVSEGIFLMYPWREMYSTFTYSSPSFSPRNFLLDSLSNENAFLWKKIGSWACNWYSWLSFR